MHEIQPKPRRAVVTGATGGIGSAIVRQLAADGLDVAVHTHRQVERAHELASQLRAYGHDATVLSADISSPHGCTQLVEEAWKWHSGVDVWVNNAGADVLTGDAASLAFEAKLQRLWEVDVLGTIRLSRDAGSRMQIAGAGALINIGWDQAVHGMEGDSGEMFGTIKGAVIAFSLSLAKSLAPHVRVNCVAPGWIKTSWGETSSDYWQMRARRESLRSRWGTPEDVARAVSFLANPSADFVNGQILPVNGGFRHGLADTDGTSSWS